MMKIKNTHIQKIAQRKDLSQILVIAPNIEATHHIVSQYKSSDPNCKTAYATKPADDCDHEDEDHSNDSCQMQKRLEECEKNIDMFGVQCTHLIDHVDIVNNLNVDLASELEKIYTELAKEKAKNAALMNNNNEQ